MISYKYTDTTKERVIKFNNGECIGGGLCSDIEYLAWLAEGNTPDPIDPPTLDEIRRGITNAIQAHLDTTAQGKGYDNIVSACSYAGYENVFQAEAVAFGQWRAAVWAYCYVELEKVLKGERPMPTIEEIISELPALVLP